MLRDTSLNLVVIGLYLLIVLFLRTKGKDSWFFQILYWVIGFPFALLGLVLGILGFVGGSLSGSSVGSGEVSRGKKSRESVDPEYSRKKYSDNRETVEIQYQQIGGSWRTLNVTSNNLDQTISHAMNNAERNVRKMSGVNGRLRAKGKKTGSIYDIRG